MLGRAEHAEAGSGGTGSSGAGGGGQSAGSAPIAAAAGEAGAGGAAEPDEPTWIAERCRATVTFDNRDDTEQGAIFDAAAPKPAELIWQASMNACRRLYRDASEVPSVPGITLIVEDSDGAASTSGTVIRMSSRYLKSQADAGVDVAREIAGVLHFQTSLVYQHGGSSQDASPPMWLVLGIADYVRLDSGYLDRDAIRVGTSYDASTKTSALFLDYLITRNDAAVYELNQRLAASAEPWTDDVFVSLFGEDLAALWSDFQATL